MNTGRSPLISHTLSLRQLPKALLELLRHRGVGILLLPLPRPLSEELSRGNPHDFPVAPDRHRIASPRMISDRFRHSFLQGFLGLDVDEMNAPF